MNTTFPYRLILAVFIYLPLIILFGIICFIIAIPIMLKTLVDKEYFDKVNESFAMFFENDENAKTRKLKECPLSAEHKNMYCMKPSGDCTFANDNHDNHPKG